LTPDAGPTEQTTDPGAALRFLLTVATLTKLIRAVLSGFLESACDSPGESPCHVYRFLGNVFPPREPRGRLRDSWMPLRARPS